MTSLVLGDLILESLTPSVNAPSETLPFSWWSFEQLLTTILNCPIQPFVKDYHKKSLITIFH